MAKVDYPQELTQAWWDKKKPVLAKVKKTGIGEALKALKQLHDKIDWKDFVRSGTTLHIDKSLADLPKLCKQFVEPVAKKAKEIEGLAKKWAADFTKDKLIPKGAAQAAAAVAEAAKKYVNAMDDFQGVQAKELVALRKEEVASMAKKLKPIMTGALKHLDSLLVDIQTYARTPTKEKYFSIFSGNSSARYYLAACQGWDQLLIEYPDVRDQCFKGKAEEVFAPGMADYGGSLSQEDFDSKVNKKTGKTGEECYVWHAKHLVQEMSNIKKFRDILVKLLTLLS